MVGTKVTAVEVINTGQILCKSQQDFLIDQHWSGGNSERKRGAKEDSRIY